VSPGRRKSDIGPWPKLALALALIVPLLSSAQTMYKWVDEKGVTHFSESPPPDGTVTRGAATKVTPKVTPPSNPSAAPTTTDWKAKDAEFRQRQIERGAKEQAEAKDDAKRQDACDRARSRIAFLQSGVIFQDNPDGSRTFMSEAQRESELARMREVASRNCR
jgi:hypothetical protein